MFRPKAHFEETNLISVISIQPQHVSICQPPPFSPNIHPRVHSREVGSIMATVDVSYCQSRNSVPPESCLCRLEPEPVLYWCVAVALSRSHVDAYQPNCRS